MTKVAVVTAANSRYMPLLRGLARSLLHQYNGHPTKRDEGFPINPDPLGFPNHNLHFFVLNCGLMPHEREWIEGIGGTVVDIAKPTLDHSRLFVQADVGFVERHALPTHIPGFDLYVWIDADAWVQNYAHGMRPYLTYASEYDIVVTPEVGHQIVYSAHQRTTAREWVRNSNIKFFGAATAVAAEGLPIINSGVFCARADSPVWRAFESAMQLALYTNDGHTDFGMDQIALNYAIYFGGIKPYCLPLSCNWPVAQSLPMLAENRLVDPLWPHHPIGIVHLSDQAKWQRLPVQRYDTWTGKITGADARFFDYFSITKSMDD